MTRQGSCETTAEPPLLERLGARPGSNSPAPLLSHSAPEQHIPPYDTSANRSGMRLLKSRSNDDGFELTTFAHEIPPYAILSHTWTDGEVTYDELVAGNGKSKADYDKIRFCGERAAADNLQYFWVDTCCIDKSDMQELQTAINSMFRWYQRASKCYVYLSDVQVPEEVQDAQCFRIAWEDAFRHSCWFMRGWTLQELLAPSTVEFFCKNRKRLGSRISLEQAIHEITKIPIGALRGQQRLSDFSVQERMSWAANRRTTYTEDKIYCLLGIFDVFLPLIYGEGEEHASQRLEDEIQRRSGQRGSQDKEVLQEPSVSSLLPFSRNESFVGREAQLESLEKLLFRQRSHQRVTIYGLGGCGKLALALEFAYRAITKNAKFLVFWVPAISRDSFELAYRDIGLLLHLPGITDDNANVLQLVKKGLDSGKSGDWLMIIDNADDASLLLNYSDSDLESPQLIDYLPRNERGKIIFTTRSKKAAVNLTQRNIIRLDDMDATEARQLMAQHLSEEALLEDGTAVDELLGLLAYLPLAIVQATAFINSNETSISDYISLFRNPTTETKLFSKRFEDPSRYRVTESTIAKTWHISFDHILKQDPLAADYLSFMACIDRVNIPQSLLPLRDSLQHVEAIGMLRGYAFITERQRVLQQSKEEKFFDIHRLVHLASRWWLQHHGKWTTWTNKAAVRLEELVPYGGHERKEVWPAYLPHAIHMARLDDALDETKKALLLDRVGRCQASLGQYSIAETTHRQALASRDKSLGKEHRNTLASMNEVGNTLQQQGHYKEAEALHRQTLAMREKVLGVKHPDTLTTSNNLGLVLDYQGKYEEAELMHRQTLAAREEVLGAEHPDTLITISYLALVLGHQGKYKEAMLIHEEALATKKKVLGVKHPETLTTLNNLAEVLSSQGEYEEAEPMYRQTLATCEEVLGVKHPDTLITMDNLAGVLCSQGRYEEAELMHKQTLATSRKVLGVEHPDTLISMDNLAGALSSQGKYEEAEVILRQTLATSRKVLSVEHPSTLITMNNLAGVLDSQDKYEEAELLYRQTLVMRKKVLGVEHPSMLTAMNNLAGVLDSQDKYEEAKLLYRQTLVMRKKVLSVKHPSMLTAMNNLAGVLDSQDKYEEAELLYRQTLVMRKKVLGVDHPDTLATVYCLAHLYADRHRYDESTALYERACAGYISTLGEDHPTTRACHQHYSQMVLSRGQNPVDVSLGIPSSN